jgi:hypothetical protein
MSTIEAFPKREVSKNPTPFYADNYAKIEFDESIPCIKLTLDGVPRFSEHYQLVQQKRIDLLIRESKRFGTINMLTDSSMAGPVLDEDVLFFKQNVLPQMEKFGVRLLAIVMPESRFAQMTIREMTERSRAITVKYFDSMREARLWLRDHSNL